MEYGLWEHRNIRGITVVNRIIQRTNIRIRTYSMFFEKENFNVNIAFLKGGLPVLHGLSDLYPFRGG